MIIRTTSTIEQGEQPRSSEATKLRDARTGSTRWLRPAAVIVAALVGVFVLFSLLYAASIHAVPGNSDGATVILEGQAMSAGHYALHGWVLSFDGFWTLEALAYAFAVAIFGVHASLLNLMPAFIATLVILVGMSMARDGRKGISANLGAISVLVLLGLPSFALASFFLQSPLHVDTVLYCLVAFLGLKSARFGWGWLLAVVLFGLGILGDYQTFALGVGPAAVAGLVAMRRQRAWRAGVTEIAAAIAGTVLAVIIRVIAEVFGTYAIIRTNPAPSKGQLVRNVPIAITYFSKLLGFGTGSVGTGGVPKAFEIAHLVVVVFVIAVVVAFTVAFVVSLVRGIDADPVAFVRHVGGWLRARFRPADVKRTSSPQRHDGPNDESASRLDDLLFIAMVASFAVFVRFSFYDTISFARYLTAAVIFAAILVGRFVTRFVAAHPSKKAIHNGLIPAGVLVAALVAGFSFGLAQNRAPRPFTSVAAFLSAHHLSQGLGDYWSSSILTVETNGALRVRPISQARGNAPLTAYQFGDQSWFDSSQRFNFVVYNTAYPFGNVTTTTAEATFGKAAHVYALPNGYDVLVWAHPFTVPLNPNAPDTRASQ